MNSLSSSRWKRLIAVRIRLIYQEGSALNDGKLNRFGPSIQKLNLQKNVPQNYSSQKFKSTTWLTRPCTPEGIEELRPNQVWGSRGLISSGHRPSSRGMVIRGRFESSSPFLLHQYISWSRVSGESRVLPDLRRDVGSRWSPLQCNRYSNNKLDWLALSRSRSLPDVATFVNNLHYLD